MKVNTILSTKKLLPTQKDLLSDFSVDEIELIEINYQNFQLPESIKNVVFTSKNAVLGLFNKFPDLKFEKVFCVGDKTANILEAKNISITLKASSAKSLAEKIIKSGNVAEVQFFCGNLRRNELPEILEENQISVKEVEVYKTLFNSVKITKQYDIILFFSPSGIKSYIEKNNSTAGIAFCIGNTTASEGIEHFENVFVADEPNVENLIKSVIEYTNYE